MKTATSVYERWIGRALQLISGAGVVVLMVHVVLNAASRKLRNAPIEGTLEWVANWYMPIIVLAGLVIAQQANQHVQAELVFDRAPKSIQLEFQLIAHALTVALCVGMAWYGWEHALENKDLNLTAGVTGVSIWQVTFLVPLGFLLYGVQVVIDAARLVRTGRVAETVPVVDVQDESPTQTVQAGEVI